jgi:hypothetical protein
MSGMSVSSGLISCTTAIADGIIIDNTDPQCVSTGWWNPSTNVAGYYDEDYEFARTSWSTASVEWTSELPAAGDYAVSVRYAAATDRAPDSPYSVHHDNGESLIKVNQREKGGIWVQLGIFQFTSGTGKIVLTNEASTGIVIADAVRFDYVVEPGRDKYWTIY